MVAILSNFGRNLCAHVAFLEINDLIIQVILFFLDLGKLKRPS